MCTYPQSRQDYILFSSPFPLDLSLHIVIPRLRRGCSPSKYVRIDQYWSKIGEMTDDENGSYKYPQLVALIKCVLSLRHGNAVPERGFSINKILLESRK